MDFIDIEVFVPGRVCIMGEHTDWAGEYSVLNPEVPNGYALVCATNEGLYARVSPYDNIQTGTSSVVPVMKFISSKTKDDGPANSNTPISCGANNHSSSSNKPFSGASLEVSFGDIEQLQAVAEAGGFFSYVAGTVIMLINCTQFREKYVQDTIGGSCGDNHSKGGGRRDDDREECLAPELPSSWKEGVRGICIDNYRTTLPMQKGLSSSAAVCVLVATAFNKFYQLGLSQNDVMELAYQGEMLTPSRCGRMDQCVVMGREAVGLMTFHSTYCTLMRLEHVGSPLYFVVVDLKSHKDTMVILRELNSCFPFPKDEKQALMHEYVQQNVVITREQAVHAIMEGDVAALAGLMQRSQALFDAAGVAICPDQLTSPVLHSFINDPVLLKQQPATAADTTAADTTVADTVVVNKEEEEDLGGLPLPLALAVKGVGSQGDGTAQILCATKEQQQRVLEYVENNYKMQAFLLTIPQQQVHNNIGY